MKIKEGYIYIMQLSDRDDIVKIGFTENHPHVRAKELSKREAAISTFIPYFYLKVSDAVAAERLAHKLFDNIRTNPKKEYFKSKDAAELEKMIIKLIFNFEQNIGLVDDKDSEAVYWKGKSLISFKQANEIAINLESLKKRELNSDLELALQYVKDEKLKIKDEAELRKQRLESWILQDKNETKEILIKRIKNLEEILEVGEDKGIVNKISQLKSELKTKFNTIVG